jgi:protein disulfide-isomerase-like protein
MRSISPVVLVLSLILLCGSSSVLGSFYSSKTHVVNLDVNNFKSEVLQDNELYLVEFYAPWCGHCKSLKPAWIKAAKKLNGMVKVGAVDANEQQNQPLASQYGVKGFPTIKLFINGKATDYQGGRTSGAIVSYAKNFIRAKLDKVTDKSLPDFLEKDSKLAKVLLITDKKSAPTLMQSMAMQYKGRLSFGMAHSSQADLMAKFGVEKAPAIVAIPTASADSDEAAAAHAIYDGPPGAPPLKDFLNKYAAAKPKKAAKNNKSKSKSKSNKEKSKSSKFMLELNPEQFKAMLEDKSPWMVEFYAPWCGHCKKLAPEWKKAAKHLRGIVRLGAVDCDTHKDLCQQYNIQGFPTIKTFAGGEAVKTDASSVGDYSGARSAKAIEKHALSMLEEKYVSPIHPNIIQSWVLENPSKPKILLVTEKDGPPNLYQALSMAFHDRVLFGMTSPMPQLLEQFQVEKAPAIMAIPAVPAGSDEAPAHVYKGPLTFEHLFAFVMQLAGPPSRASSSGPASAQKIRFIENNDVFTDACGSAVGLCAIAFTPADRVDETTEQMKDLSKKVGNKPIRYLVANRQNQQQFANTFQLSTEPDLTEFVVVSVRKNIYARFFGVFNPDNASEFIDMVLGGRTSIAKIHGDLPAFNAEQQQNESDSQTESQPEEPAAAPTDKDEL